MGVKTQKLLDAVTATGAGAGRAARNNSNRTYQAVGSTTAGVGAANVRVEASNDNVNFEEIGAITLTLGTSETSDSFASNASYAFIRGRVNSISGTGAVVTLWMGD